MRTLNNHISRHCPTCSLSEKPASFVHVHFYSSGVGRAIVSSWYEYTWHRHILRRILVSRLIQHPRGAGAEDAANTPPSLSHCALERVVGEHRPEVLQVTAGATRQSVRRRKWSQHTAAREIYVGRGAAVRGQLVQVKSLRPRQARSGTHGTQSACSSWKRQFDTHSFQWLVLLICTVVSP